MQRIITALKSGVLTSIIAVVTSANAENLVQNADFGMGNVGFTSEYTFAPAGNTTEGQYTVNSNPAAWNAGLSPCGDHTTGTGLMMVVNGDPVLNVVVWSQVIAVEPETDYEFSFWAASAHSVSPGQLQVRINDVAVGPVASLSSKTCEWQQVIVHWNSGDHTSATVSILNQNTAVFANDFVLDDFSFAVDCPADIDPDDGDGVVDINDFSEVILHWGTAGPQGDVNGDGIVDINDFTAIVLGWGDC